MNGIEPTPNNGIPPRWFTVTMSLAVFMLVFTVVFVGWEIDRRNEDRVQRCETSALLRNDHRSMWTALFEAFPEAAVETGLDKELDGRLPELDCDGWTLKPVTERSG